MQFAPPESSSFTRTLPSSHHDGLSNVQAFLDSRLLNEGSRGEYTRVRLGRAPDVTWTLAPILDGARRFQLRYRATGTLAISGARARFEWPVLERRHGWRIRDAHLTITAPAGATLLSGAGMIEPGWNVAQRPDGITAEKQDIGGAESVTTRLELNRDGLSVAEPAWQFASGRSDELMPAFVSAGAFIVVIGIGVLVMVRAMLPKDAADHGRAAASGLRASGWVLVALAIALGLVVRYALDSFGPWAMAVPASVGLVGLMFLVGSRRQ